MAARAQARTELKARAKAYTEGFHYTRATYQSLSAYHVDPDDVFDRSAIDKVIVTLGTLMSPEEMNEMFREWASLPTSPLRLKLFSLTEDMNAIYAGHRVGSDITQPEFGQYLETDVIASRILQVAHHWLDRDLGHAFVEKYFNLTHKKEV